MNYELAKQLKDAGFPQGGDGKWIVSPDKIVARREDRVYVATLSELIKACGERLNRIEQPDHGPLFWEATGDKGKTLQQGSSPEEAVARLWLALQKKV